MKGQLEIMKTLGIKPNFSELERAFGIERHTIKKYYDGYEGKSPNRNKPSKLDKYYNEIKSKISLCGINQMGLYQYLKMISKHGELFEFNIFSTTLGYSRLHNFVYSKTKTREDVERCLMTTFKFMGGVPKCMLTDNMRAVVDITGNKRKVNPEFNQFAKNMSTAVKLCKPMSPETKGKDETANKFMAWLIPYNHEFEDEEDLIKIIESIRNKVNSTVCQTTNIPPILLFEKEKDILLILNILVNLSKLNRLIIYYIYITINS